MPKRKIETFGPRLRELRLAAGLSQAQLGEMVDLAGSQINKLETNVSQPMLATAFALADALGVSCEAFSTEPDASADAAPPAPRPRGRPRKAAEPEAREEKPSGEKDKAKGTRKRKGSEK